MAIDRMRNTKVDVANMETDLDDILKRLHGRIRDVDTHEMYPARLWAGEYGNFIAPVADFFVKTQPEHIPNSLSVKKVTDEGPILREELSSYWEKACLAPSAFDMKRRVEFLDVAGIDDSLIFGTMMSIVGQQWASGGGGSVENILGTSKLDFDLLTMGNDMVRAHNDWCIRVAAISNRLRPVAAIMTTTLQEAVDEARRMIDGGVRAVTIPTGQLFDGVAPSHPQNDIFWRLLADNDIALLFHVGTESAFAREYVGWTRSPLFETNRDLPTELPVDPFSLAVCSLPIQNYLTNLVLGAVFERVPNLRCGVMELSASWVGSSATTMDMWVKYFSRRFENILSMKPSEYFRRNIRVSPFTFEPVDEYIDRYPMLADILCFSTDYPHYEGGPNPIEDVVRRVMRFGPDFIEKFFVTNAELVMPR